MPCSLSMSTGAWCVRHRSNCDTTQDMQAAALVSLGNKRWSVTALLQTGGPRGGPAEGAAGSGEELDTWFLDGLDLLLQHSPDQGERAAEAVQDQLTQIDA